MKNNIRFYIIILVHLIFAFPVIGQIIFEDDFESGNFKSQWTATPGAIDGVVSIVESNDVAYEGFYGVTIGKNADGDPNLNTLDLALDLSTYDQVELSFWIKDIAEENNAQDGILFSDNGGQSFTKVFSFDAEGWQNNAYGQLPPLDIDKLAADNSLNLTSQFIIRFQQFGDRDFGGSFGSNGFYLDEVIVRVPQIEYVSLPFFDNFEQPELAASWKIAHPFIDGQTTNDIRNVRPGGQVTLFKNDEDNAVSGFNYMGIGRRNDGELTTNALDLHLNLGGLTQAELSFWISDFAEQNHSLDGIYFSDNGGQNFTKVFTFDAEGWTDLSYGRLPPLDIDKLATANGLNLTSQFIIRFQQHGNRDFGGSFGSNGFIIDDVSVNIPQTEFAAVPFFDDFEKPELSNNWKWVHPFIDGQSIDNINEVRPGGYVGLENNQDFAYQGFNYVAIGRLNDGSFTANALDLYVNLSGVTNSELSFWINDINEINHSFDGVYFSNNGGVSFQKVFTFDLENVQDYNQITLDINTLAASNNIGLTNQFVIRFQQYGDRDFGGSFGSNGYLLDDVQICVNNNCTPAPPSNINISIATTPEVCNQENGSLTATATGGTAPYTYAWSNGQTGATINNLSAGNYTVTVTDNSGATATSNATLQNNGQAPIAGFTFSTNGSTVTFQTNNSNGCVWTFGDGSQSSDCNTSHTYSQDGTYSVTLAITDACGDDSKSQQVIINNGGNIPNCDNLSVGIATAPIDECFRYFKAVPSGGTPPYSFQWRDGQTSDSVAYDISVNPNYAYTVTDANGCTWEAESIATCTPTNNNSDGTCSDADMAFLIGEWEGTFDQLDSVIQSSMIMEVISVEDGLFLGAMVRPDILSAARIVVGTCRNDSIWWSETESLEDLDLMGLYLSEPGNHTTTTINGDYFNTNPSEFAGTFSLTKNCSYPIAAFTPNIGPNGQVQFQNNSLNNPLAQFWEFGDGGENFVINPSHTYTANGTYEITLVVSNGCGSRGDDTLRQNIVIDNIGGNNNQTVQLYAGEVEGNTGDQVLLPIIVENLDTITVLEGQIILANPSIGQIVGVQAGAIDVGTINPNSLKIGYFASNGIGVALNPKDTLFYLVIDLTGMPEDQSLVTMPDFEVYGAFTANSFDPLPYDSQDGLITITGNFDITGRVQTFGNTGIGNTTVDLAITLLDGSQDTKTTTTQNDGSYTFQDIPSGSTCSILPNKNTAVKNGLSTAALFLGQRYILGLSAPQINNPFQLFAGDANCDDRFSTVDLFLIQKVLVEIDDSFVDCDGSWDFTPATDRSMFTMNLDYHTGTVRKELVLTPSGDVTADFIGVKKGDLLNLADPANILNELAESRATQSLTLEMVKTTKGNTIEIAFYPTQTAELASYQLAFNFDQQALGFSEIGKGSTLPITNIATDGTLLMSWFTPNGTSVSLDSNTPIFSLKFTKKNDKASILTLADERLVPIGFDTNLDKWAIQLNAPAEEVETPFQLYQNSPNPFSQTTSIRFDLPKAMPATLLITNSLGQVIQRRQGNYNKAKNVITISVNQLPKGLYYYTLSAADFSATKRLLVIE